MKRPIRLMPWWLVCALLIVNFAGFVEPAQAQAPLRARLKALPFKIAYESYVNNNWEIFVMNPDGSDPVNLTQTPSVNEHYPQISPDGTKICFAVDEGEGRDAVRSLWVMDINGKHRRKLADHAREGFWSPDGKVIGFLPQEYPKFDVIDYYTKGMSFYDLATGAITPHVNSANLRHLYNPCWSANGKWIVATVHAGMGYSHTILLIEARGTNIINLKIPGCRPDLSPDGKQIAWARATMKSRPLPLIWIPTNPPSASGVCASKTPRTRFITSIGRRTAAFWPSAADRMAKGI